MEEEKSKSKIGKILSVISMAFLVLCVGILVYSTISYSKNGIVNFFGYSLHAIQTESMEPEINVGDLVIVKKVPYSEIDIGDDILFKCEDEQSKVYGMYVVHRVIEKTDTEGVYITKGVNNPVPDSYPSKAEGKVVKVSSAFGGVFLFFTNSRNLIMIIAIVGMLIFTFLQLCSVIANASKLKEEKNREKVENDVELKEKIRQELLNEMKNQNDKEQEQPNDSIDVAQNGQNEPQEKVATDNGEDSNDSTGGENK